MRHVARALEAVRRGLDVELGFEAFEVGGQRVDVLEIDGVFDDRVALLGHVRHVPTEVDAHGWGV